MYRPDDWKDNKPFFHISRSKEYCYEAGADAILEALKKNGAIMTSDQMRLLAPDRKYPYGYLVFIPD